MPAVLVDVGYHLVEPDTSGQTVTLSVSSSNASDAAVAGFELRAQIVTAKQGPYFEGVRFAGNLWNTFPHVESGSPYPANRTLASGNVAFTQGFEARADGTLVKLTIDTTGIPAGSYEFRLVGTQLGSSSFRRADGSGVSEIITNGTLHVRSIWQNPDNPNDVDGDGSVTPRDVLLLLNLLSKTGSHALQMPSPGDDQSIRPDVNGDGFVSPLDGLHIIGCLNGEGCISSPQQILAQATPLFQPESPGSTSVGNPVPDSPNSVDPPPVETDPDTRDDCVWYGLDEDGNPVPIIDPELCEGYGPVVPVTTSAAPSGLETPTPEASSTVGESLQEIPPAPHATAIASQSVDAVIVDVAEELSDETSNELVDLGLDALFAAAS